MVFKSTGERVSFFFFLKNTQNMLNLENNKKNETIPKLWSLCFKESSVFFKNCFYSLNLIFYLFSLFFHDKKKMKTTHILVFFSFFLFFKTKNKNSF